MMLGSRLLHPKSLSLEWQIVIPRSLILLILFHFINGANVVAEQTITLNVTSPQINFLPFSCHASDSVIRPSPCSNSAAWFFSSCNDSISTTRLPNSSLPLALPGSIGVAQMFLSINGPVSVLTMYTLPSSNASVNISLWNPTGSGPPELLQSISAVFNSSLGSLTILNLAHNLTYIFAATVSLEPGHIFALKSFNITIPDNTSTSAIWPTPTGTLT